MRFVVHAWLWWLIVIPVVYIIAIYLEKRREKRFLSFAGKDVWKAIAPEFMPRAQLGKWKLYLGAFVFLIIALARPQWGSHEEVSQASGLDIMLVVDVSNSMEVEDVMPNRLKQAKHLIRSITDRLSGDRIGLVIFAGSAYEACPLTTDLEYLMERVQSISPSFISNQGTDIGIALETASNALNRGAEDSTFSSTSSGYGNGGAQEQPASHVVVLISDGEDQESGALQQAAKLPGNGIKTYVFGVGTQKGGPVPVRDEQGNLQGYKKNRLNQPIVSTFRPDFLMQVAASAEGRYWNVTTGEAEVDELLMELTAMTRSDYAERRFVVYEDRFYVPLALAIMLLILEISIPVRVKVRRVAKSVVLLVCCVMPWFSKPAFAIDAAEYSTGHSASSLSLSLSSPMNSLNAYLENEKGLEAFKAGSLEEAQKNFGSAQAREPDRSELQFNQGVIQFQQGQVDPAVHAFQESAKNPKLLGPSLFNLGGVLAKKGDLPGAIKSYLSAVDAARKVKDQSLEDDSRKNIELLMVERQKQKQQEQKDKKQSAEKNDGEKNNKDQNNKDQKNQETEKKEAAENQPKPKKYEDSSESRKQFKSQKLSREDAERVMAELKNREREIQGKLRKQNPLPQTNQKDW